MTQNEDILTLLMDYRDSIIGAARSSMTDPQQNNKFADNARACGKRLSESEEGRLRIIELMSDYDPHVRLWAATDSLQWVPDHARTVLESIRDSDGLAAFEAKWTLIEFDNGTLSSD